MAAKNSKQKGPGRPRVEVDEGLVVKLSSLCVPVHEIALLVGCDERTLQRNFAPLLKKGRAEASQKLRAAQFETALKGNPTMQIWLGKQLLGQRDEPVEEEASGPEQWSWPENESSSTTATVKETP